MSIAVDRIIAERDGKIKGQIQNAIKKGVAAALIRFCEQQQEFDQAVEQSDKSLQQCLDFVADGVVDGAISDMDAYTKAAQFFFQGAVIEWKMTLRMDAHESSSKKIELDFYDLI